MRPRGLADTGALLALLDRSDPWHERCVEAFSGIRLPLATTGAVLAELFHFLSDEPQSMKKAWRLLRSGAFSLLPIADEDLEGLETLMKKYAPITPWISPTPRWCASPSGSP